MAQGKQRGSFWWRCASFSVMERLDWCVRRSFGCVGRKTDGMTSALDCHLGDYDPDLQEDLYLRGTTKAGVPYKNTFIHFKEPISQIQDAPKVTWCSAPSVLQNRSFHTKTQMTPMEKVHLRGSCKPCAYYLYKRDGCRLGEDCQFCHFCKWGEVKRRKRQNKRLLKAASSLNCASATARS